MTQVFAGEKLVLVLQYLHCAAEATELQQQQQPGPVGTGIRAMGTSGGRPGVIYYFTCLCF